MKNYEQATDISDFSTFYAPDKSFQIFNRFLIQLSKCRGTFG